MGIKNKNRTKCEIYSRVVGFLTPVSQWNVGKKAEFKDRVTFSIDKIGGNLQNARSNQ